MDPLPKDLRAYKETTYNRDAALEQVRTIRNYWESKGKKVDVWLHTENVNGEKTYGVRSNLNFTAVPPDSEVQGVN